MPDMDSTDTAAIVARIQRMSQVPRILDACARLTGMGFAAVANVTERSWVTCASLDWIGFGLKPGDTLPIETTFCDQIRRDGQVVVFNDAARAPQVADHVAIRIYPLRSYISVPIYLPGGDFFGTLCAIDRDPRDVDRPEIIETFQLFAALIGSQLVTERQLTDAEARLSAAREVAALREHFVAVLGHDLRNPLAAVTAGVRMLQRGTGEAGAILAGMEATTRRMAGLLDNLLDFARGRLGGGIVPRLQEGVDLGALVTGIADEFRAVSDTVIDVELELLRPVACDPQQIGQLVSNLLANAVNHGAPGQPVRVVARSGPAGLTIAASNRAPPIAPEVLRRLFEPYRRGAAAGAGGLGLGLYIASEIAAGHGGTLTAAQDGGVVTFTFAMPA